MVVSMISTSVSPLFFVHPSLHNDQQSTQSLGGTCQRPGQWINRVIYLVSNDVTVGGVAAPTVSVTSLYLQVTVK